jgi:hypothetical protein
VVLFAQYSVHSNLIEDALVRKLGDHSVVGFFCMLGRVVAGGCLVLLLESISHHALVLFLEIGIVLG